MVDSIASPVLRVANTMTAAEVRAIYERIDKVDQRAFARKLGGRKAQREGGNFEKIVLASQGSVVRLVKIDTGMRWVRGPIGLKQLPQAAAFDFCGVFCGTGRGLFFDAKSVGAQRASFDASNEKVMKRHQIANLRALSGGDAIAGVLVRSERVGRYLWMPAAHLVPRTLPWDHQCWIDLGPTTGTVQFQRLK